MKSPFKFLDAYTLEDKDVFFGRKEEVDRLYEMVFKTPLILVYGMSGTGKTSLIKCGLASRFDGPDWLPVHIRRNANINDSLDAAIEEVLKDRQGSLVEDVSYIFRYYLRPVYFIFDQLEELFIMGNRDEQQQFVESIRELVNAELACKIILVMREEYIGHLYHFEKVLPTIFDHRLRVEPMNSNKVQEVMLQSFKNSTSNWSPRWNSAASR